MPEVKRVLYRVEVFEEGDEVCALIGDNIQTGMAGFGKTASEALRRLADEIESEIAHHAMTGE